MRVIHRSNSCTAWLWWVPACALQPLYVYATQKTKVLEREGRHAIERNSQVAVGFATIGRYSSGGRENVSTEHVTGQGD
ncbi:hypothetical protein EDD17DRAFT_1604625 [Pisolithus thermaeus]|nr:hypothetical protein EDD17DRAFT_1604625 [Pisolithus thermaeus]